MDSAESKESGKQSKVHFEETHKEIDALSDCSNSSFSYASDLSQELAINNIIHSNPAIPSKPDVPESPGAMQTSENSSLSRTQSASKSSSHIRLSGMLGSHDPNRIPVSIFSARPSNPMEWSIASTESLFSIHVGNNSFSRDHFNFLNKSGELLLSTDLTHHPANLPHFVEPAKVESKIVNDLGESWTPTGPQNSAISSHSPADHRKGILTPVDKFRGRNSVSYHSDDSINSARSFKFPVLAGEGPTTSSVTTNSKMQTPSKQSLEHQSFETTSASPTARTSWLSCFYCCPRR